jgi:hypothetical protein
MARQAACDEAHMPVPARTLTTRFHAIVEGILYASHYDDMLTAVCADLQGTISLY